MLYITCLDGHEYFRYDNSPYVKWCICREDSIYNAQHLKCMRDPVCRAKWEQSQKNMTIMISLWVVCFVFLLVFFVYKLVKLK